MNITQLKKTANEIRVSIIEMLYKAGSGHPGGALGLADIFTYLYFQEGKLDPKKPKDKNRDFIFVSNGHTCPVWYATLSQRGYFLKKELDNLRKINSKLQGHPHKDSVPGIEHAAGPLGQGISQATGLAASLKRDNKKNRVFCFVGDGELEEGQCWEALMFAAKEKLDNLYIIVDRNKIQIDGTTENICHLEPLHRKLSAFGGITIDFDGNDFKQIKAVFSQTKKLEGKPKFLIAHNIPGKGVSFMEKKVEWHGKAPNEQEANLALKELRGGTRK